MDTMTLKLAGGVATLLILLMSSDYLVLLVRRRRQRQHIKRLMRRHMQAALDGDHQAISQVTQASEWLRQRGL